MENKFEFLKAKIGEEKEIIRFGEYLEYPTERGETMNKYDSKEHSNDESMLDFFEKTLNIKIEEKLIEENADKINWNFIIKLPHFPFSFSEKFIEKFSQDIPWNNIIYYRQDLSSDFYIKYKKNIDWFNNENIKSLKYTEEQAREIAELTNDITTVVNCNDFSEEFLLEFRNKILWFKYEKFRNKSIGFLKKFVSYIPFDQIFNSTEITEEFLDEFKDHISWFSFLDNYYISNRLLEKYSTQILNYHKKHNNNKLNSFLQELEQQQKRKLSTEESMLTKKLVEPLYERDAEEQPVAYERPVDYEQPMVERAITR